MKEIMTMRIAASTTVPHPILHLNVNLGKTRPWKLPKCPCTSVQISSISSYSIPAEPVKYTPNPWINHHSVKPRRSSHRPNVASSSATPTAGEEEVFFDGGAHYGDLLANLIFGFTLLWTPLTVAAVFRAMFLRYRFTNLRVTVISGLTGSDRRDFTYAVIKDVQVVPRLIGEWGDVVITLTDDTKVDLRSVPKFRDIAQYCLFMAKEENTTRGEARGRKGF